MGGSSDAPAQPATTTTVQDIPAWEQGYVTDLLGQAQTLAAQPYQQYTGPQVAGFTPDQTQAFSNIENMSGTYQPTADAATSSVMSGANTANNIYDAGAGDVNSSTGYNPLAAVSPYLNSAAGYNSAAAAQPWLNQAANYSTQAANAATPQGIQSYMSPYTNDVVNGIQNEANLNWSQNIMPGVNDKFVGSGQYASGRNAQVLGQAAGNFQTGLSANVANALESGYTTAGNQAATQAGILGNLGNQALTGANDAGNAQTSQISNLLNQAQTAGTATNQQAQNLQSAGTTLGNLTATQGAQQTAAGTALGNLSNQEQQENLTQNQALQAVGQQQQQLNQTNLNTAMTNFQNQVNYPEQQTEYLNQIIRGLPAPAASTSSSQTTPAYSTSPLAGIGGAGTGALSVLGSNGSQVGSVTAAAHGGLIKGYAEGGMVDDDSDNPLAMIDETYDPSVDDIEQSDLPKNPLEQLADNSAPVSPTPAMNPIAPDEPIDQLSMEPIDTSDLDTSDSQHNAEAPDGMQYKGPTQSDLQQQQLLAMARGMLTPSLSGNPWASLGQGLGAAQDVQTKQQQLTAQQNALNYQRQMDAKKFAFERDKTAKEQALEQEKIEQGKYTPIKDVFGNVTGVMETKTGKIVTPSAAGMPSSSSEGAANEPPAADPQKAAMQILDETGTPFTPVASKQDITGRNAQAKSYRDQANGAKSTIQQLDMLGAQTGKYTPGKAAGAGYSTEASLDMGGAGATARAEADKASKALANSFMAQNAGAKGSGIRMVEFDAGAVPNADMTDEARTALITKNKAIANSQIQRAAISDMYPRMQLSNVNAIMDNYEQKNPPVLPNGSANPNWMPYKDWLASGRPNTAVAALDGNNGAAPVSSSASAAPTAPSQPTLVDLIAEKKRRQQQ